MKSGNHGLLLRIQLGRQISDWHIHTTLTNKFLWVCASTSCSPVQSSPIVMCCTLLQQVLRFVLKQANLNVHQELVKERQCAATHKHVGYTTLNHLCLNCRCHILTTKTILLLKRQRRPTYHHKYPTMVTVIHFNYRSKVQARREKLKQNTMTSFNSIRKQNLAIIELTQVNIDSDSSSSKSAWLVLSYLSVLFEVDNIEKHVMRE